MKNLIISITLILVVLGTSSYVFGLNNQRTNGVSHINQLPKEAVSPKEIEGLQLLREEEKLARDVYSALYDKWNLRIFSNIARSEQRHMSRIKDLLDKYDLKDPVAGLKSGEFNNPEFTQLYNELVSKGSESLVSALTVGATIEDLDIKDLNEWIALSDNQDIRMVYGNLKRGSENHIRSFNRQLQRNGASYTAQYISQSELDSILSSAQGQGKRRNR